MCVCGASGGTNRWSGRQKKFVVCRLESVRREIARPLFGGNWVYRPLDVVFPLIPVLPGSPLTGRSHFWGSQYIVSCMVVRMSTQWVCFRIGVLQGFAGSHQFLQVPCRSGYFCSFCFECLGFKPRAVGWVPPSILSFLVCLVHDCPL